MKHLDVSGMPSNGDPARAIVTPGWFQTPERFYCDHLKRVPNE